jgi:hypothetical protein
MRAALALIFAIVTVASVGCYHDKYQVSGPKREDYVLPPDDKRYNEPDTATYRAPAKPKQQDTLLNKGGPRGVGGNGVGGL